MQELEFLSKQRCVGCADDCDVYIGFHNSRQVGISFRRNSYVKLTKTGYITIAPLHTRLYFKEADKYNGWKLTDYRNSNTKCEFKIAKSLLPIGTIEKGAYNLEFDKDRKLYYIAVEHKLK